MKKIHVIVNCTNRKKVAPEIEISDFSEQDPFAKSRAWVLKLNRLLRKKNELRLPAFDLYKGGYWSQVRNLCAKSIRGETEIDLSVISCGYGLINVDQRILSYSATFAAGKLDSIVRDGGKDSPNRTRQIWWDSLTDPDTRLNPHSNSFQELFAANKGDYFLLITSRDYLSAIKNDLEVAFSKLEDKEKMAIISSYSESEGFCFAANIIRPDARLQCSRCTSHPKCKLNCTCCERECKVHLLPRGIRGLLAIQLASKILENFDEWGPDCQDIKNKIETFFNEMPLLEKYDRKRGDDKSIKLFINNELSKRHLSRTWLLRSFRDQGMACEQGRFKILYEEVLNERKEQQKKFHVA